MADHLAVSAVRGVDVFAAPGRVEGQLRREVWGPPGVVVGAASVTTQRGGWFPPATVSGQVGSVQGKQKAGSDQRWGLVGHGGG